MNPQRLHLVHHCHFLPGTSSLWWDYTSSPTPSTFLHTQPSLHPDSDLAIRLSYEQLLRSFFVHLNQVQHRSCHPSWCFSSDTHNFQDCFSPQRAVCGYRLPSYTFQPLKPFFRFLLSTDGPCHL